MEANVIPYIYNKPSTENDCCNNTFIDHKSFKLHFTKQHSKSNVIYKCGKCNEEYTSINRVSSHYYQCNGLKEKIPEAKKEFVCNFCDRSFDTANGKGQHEKHSHRKERDETIDNNRKHNHWSESDLYLMAEIELSWHGIGHINQYIQEHFPDRTIQSIKGQRNKNDKYKEIKSDLESSMRTKDLNATVLSTPSITPSNIANHSISPMKPTNELLPDIDFIESEITTSTQAALNPKAISFQPASTNTSNKLQITSTNQKLKKKRISPRKRIAPERFTREGMNHQFIEQNIVYNQEALKDYLNHHDSLEEENSEDDQPIIINEKDCYGDSSLIIGNRNKKNVSLFDVNEPKSPGDPYKCDTIIDEDTSWKSTFITTLSNITPEISNQQLKTYVENVTNNINNELTFDNIISNSYFKPLKVKNKTNRKSDDTQGKNRNQIRKARYARYQWLFRKRKKDLADIMINGEKENKTPEKKDIEDVFKNIFESLSPSDDFPSKMSKQSLKSCYSPIKEEEVLQHLKSIPNKAPGPDGIMIPFLKRIPIKDLLAMFNLVLLNQDLPLIWKKNLTKLIPKGLHNLHMATNWRPITLSSVFVRLLHRILAARLSLVVKLNPRQRAFIPVDGCFENTTILNTLIKRAKRSLKELNIIGIDIAKAFDSVSRDSIQRSLELHGVEKNMITYIMNSYLNNTTDMICGNVKIDNVKLLRGVKQGDPLSPILFNIIMDELFHILPDYVGATVNENDKKLKVSSLGFADDLILIAETKSTMQKLIKITSNFFEDRSLRINANKCYCLRLIPNRKLKKIKIGNETEFAINGNNIPMVDSEGIFKYLGIKFGHDGVTSITTDEYSNILLSIKKAPLKPQQKVFMMNQFVIPKLLHKLILGKHSKILLQEFDITTRKYVKEILHLPSDTPDSFIHCDIGNGGMGITKLMDLVPKTYLSRLENMKKSKDVITREITKDSSITVNVKNCEKILGLSSNNNMEYTKENLKDYNVKRNQEEWHSKIDGSGLIQMKSHRKGQNWIRGATKIVKGSTYIDMVKLRCGKLPTKDTCNRGRKTDNKCRHCNMRVETVNHILQKCSYVHHERIMRHNNIVKLLQTKCKDKGLKVINEPRFITENGLRKPDLVIVTNEHIIVTDVSVTSDGQDTLESARKEKVRIYDNECINNELHRIYGQDKVILHLPYILSARGAYHNKNDELLKLVKLQHIRDLSVCRTMENGLKVYKHFMKV